MTENTLPSLTSLIAKQLVTSFSFWMLLLTMMGSFGLAFFYTGHENLALKLEQEQKFKVESANAVKHAYAAAQIYSLLTSHWVSDQDAENIVSVLGIANEYAERVFKLGSPDTSLEMMKDLHNNQAGVMAARWYGAHPQDAEGLTLHDLIVVLEQRKQLVVNAKNDIKLTKDEAYLGSDPADILGVTAWYEQVRQNVSGNVGATLAGIYQPNTNPVAVYP